MIFHMKTRAMIAVLLAAGIAFSFSTRAADSTATAAPRASPVTSGDIAPDFTLTDQNGRSHSLSAERGKRPVVLVFYRGYW